MSRPPDSVALVARVHWVVGAVILLSAALVTALTRKFPVEFGWSSYAIAFFGSGLYLLTGTLVWLGAPPGRQLSYVCTILYLARPNLGDRLMRIMRSEEFKAHFTPAARDKSA